MLLNATDRIEVSTTLTPGWNWVSFNVVGDEPIRVDEAFDEVDDDDMRQVILHDGGTTKTKEV